MQNSFMNKVPREPLSLSAKRTISTKILIQLSNKDKNNNKKQSPKLCTIKKNTKHNFLLISQLGVKFSATQISPWGALRKKSCVRRWRISLLILKFGGISHWGLMGTGEEWRGAKGTSWG